MSCRGRAAVNLVSVARRFWRWFRTWQPRGGPTRRSSALFSLSSASVLTRQPRRSRLPALPAHSSAGLRSCLNATRLWSCFGPRTALQSSSSQPEFAPKPPSLSDRVVLLQCVAASPCGLSDSRRVQAGGVGLSLTEASRVYMMDLWWNSAVDAQAMDRVHRQAPSCTSLEVTSLEFVSNGKELPQGLTLDVQDWAAESCECHSIRVRRLD
eukprot:3939353-Rhodomonas_salina.5